VGLEERSRLQAGPAWQRAVAGEIVLGRLEAPREVLGTPGMLGTLQGSDLGTADRRLLGAAASSPELAGSWVVVVRKQDDLVAAAAGCSRAADMSAGPLVAGR
jgi:hypothetical protein